MFTFILVMAAGVIIGYMLRRFPKIEKVNSLIHMVVCALLFLLGLSIGLNQLIVNNLSYFCGQAAVIASLSITGSILASFGLYHLFLKKHMQHEK